jgi:hypothetical protein
VEDRLELVELARRAFDWIGSVAVDVDGGLGWLEDGVLFDDLYSGTAGVLLGCAEAAAAGLATAQVSAGARARLLHLAHHSPGVATMPDDGLFSGWAGVAVALRAWSRVAADAAAAEAATRVISQIAGRTLHAPADPLRYTDVISGDTAATWWTSPSGAARLFSPPGTIAAAGRCRPRFRRDRTARR